MEQKIIRNDWHRTEIEGKKTEDKPIILCSKYYNWTSHNIVFKRKTNMMWRREAVDSKLIK